MLAEIKGLNEECGVFAVYGHQDAAKLTYYGLYSLQHRGQEGAGMVVSNRQKLQQLKGLGLVSNIFNEQNVSELKGEHAIGHVLYSASDNREIDNVQPLHFQSMSGAIALAYNGSITNASLLKEKLEQSGSIFHTNSNAEIIVHLIKKSNKQTKIERIKDALNQLEGAYALVILFEDCLVAALDPFGIRPLSLAKLDSSYIIASETVAFDLIGAEFIRDIEPGELVVIDDYGLQSERFAKSEHRALCTMEYIYFARPDSNINQQNVHSIRKRLGMRLAEVAPAEADLVTGVPDSSLSAAIGYAEASGIPYELGLIRNRYVGRTFIQPTQNLREHGVQMKLSAVRNIVEGKRVVIVDDSIVRGTTSKRIVNLLKNAGAKEVHVRISAPPITHPCIYESSMSSSDELMAANYSIEEMRNLIGADSLEFLPLDDLTQTIVGKEANLNCGLCLACYTGEYPTKLKDRLIGAKENV